MALHTMLNTADPVWPCFDVAGRFEVYGDDEWSYCNM